MVDMGALKELRAITHAPIKECKAALEQADGDIAQAQEVLRERGALKAASKADRATNEGIVMVKQYGDKVVGLKLACETDFVAKNDTFKDLAAQIVDRLSNVASLASYDELSPEVKESLEKVLKDNFVTIGENMQIIDAFVQSGNAYIYTHPGDKVAAVVFYDGDAQKAKNVALQVAAMAPAYLSVDDVPTDEQERLSAEFAEEMKDSGKPADIIEKIVAGKLQKHMSEIVLLEQTSIVDDSKSVKEMLGDTTIEDFTRLAI